MNFDDWIVANEKRYGYIPPAQKLELLDAFEAGAKTEREKCENESIESVLLGLIADSDLDEVVCSLDMIAKNEGKWIKLFSEGGQIYPAPLAESRNVDKAPENVQDI